MRFLVIFPCILVTVQGLGNIFPYLNGQTATYTDQTIAPWDQGSCSAGVNQSPINVVTLNAIVHDHLHTHTHPHTLPPLIAPQCAAPLIFAGYNQNGIYGVSGNSLEVYVSHLLDITGAAATILIPHTPMLSGGPLPAGVSYAFSHIEFRWGSTDNVGSEHTFDGAVSPLEMQVVHYKSTFATYDAAVQGSKAAPDGTVAIPDPAAIVVLSYQFQISAADNVALNPILTEVAKQTAAGTGTPGNTINMRLSDLLNPATQANILAEYYYYDGSLTQPQNVAPATGATANDGCLEIVRWILFTTKLQISTGQLAQFRLLTNHGVTQTAAPGSNTRAIQTNTNPVHHCHPIVPIDTHVPLLAHAAQQFGNILGASLLSVGTFGLVFTALNTDETSKALSENPVVDFLQNFEERFISPPAVEERQANHHHHPQHIQY